MSEILDFEVTSHTPPQSVGWLETKLSQSVMIKLKSYIATAKINPTNVNNTLAGNISKSLLLKDKDHWFFINVLVQLINKFSAAFPLYMGSAGGGFTILTEDAPYCVDPFWVNFQKENEFNPMHSHSGIWSFVIFVKIPTDWREQHALPFSANSNGPKASDFEFYYSTMLGQMGKTTFPLDKESEGTMLFFPASMVHTVYPFYNCDKERISISGNIRFDISENSMKQFRSHQKNGNETRR